MGVVKLGRIVYHSSTLGIFVRKGALRDWYSPQ